MVPTTTHSGPKGRLLLAGAALALAACAPAAQPTPPSAPPAGPAPAGGSTSPDLRQLSGLIQVDGSSTVFPITEAMAEEFQKATGGRVRVTVGISGTGGGFKKFCANETDISDASRPITASEMEACAKANVTYIELPVAFDGLSVMVNPRNTFVGAMKVSELKKMWEPAAQGQITRWSQVRPDWPDRHFRLYGPGTDSGTFDYFTQAINGKEKASRGDFTASEDDNVLVQGIASDVDALGYFGYAYYVENRDKLKLVAIDNEKGAAPVLPSPETIANGTYQPLGRPIFIYVKQAALDRAEVREYVRFFTNPKNATNLVTEVGYVPFPEKYYVLAWQRVEAQQTGTVFAGKGTEGLTLDGVFGAPKGS